MINTDIQTSYYSWLVQKAMPFSQHHTQLLEVLYSTVFIPNREEDNNRAIDGINLRHRFGIDQHIPQSIIDYYLINNKPCSMLEMMIALAIRMEDTIMSDPYKGDRTSYWFACMLGSMNIFMDDDRFDIDWFEHCMYIFNNRLYMPNGCGGLFTITDPSRDMREYEIWSQMNFYLVEVDRDSEHINI